MRRVATLGLLLLGAATGAAAQDGTRAHMEGCLVWSGPGAVGVRNECSRPIVLSFMSFEDRQITTVDLPPGGRFVADATWEQPDGFMFAACPTGYRPSVAFSIENKEAIGSSLYNCVVGKPTS